MRVTGNISRDCAANGAHLHFNLHFSLKHTTGTPSRECAADGAHSDAAASCGEAGRHHRGDGGAEAAASTEAEPAWFVWGVL